MSPVRTAKEQPSQTTSAEHIYLEDESAGYAAPQPKTIAERFDLRDRLRGAVVTITLYDEGVLDVVERRGRRVKRHRLQLRYLDPVPSVRQHYPKRLLRVAAGCGAAAALATVLAQFAALTPLAAPAAAAATVGMLAAFGVFAYASHEKTVFWTLHGRAPALRLTAGLGAMRRYRAALPKLVAAIEQAEESIGDDTAIYLRAEMREHYRLRGEGVLNEQDCSEGTGRILLHFDDQI